MRCFCGKVKQASFGFTSTHLTHCKCCKLPGMVNHRLRKCRCPDSKEPTFGFPNTRPICCKNCKEIGMVNLKARTCSCGKQCSYGFAGGPATHCATCIRPGMIDRTHKRCKCGKFIPSFAKPGEAATCCSECIEDGMITTNIRCVCGLACPSFGYPNAIPICCVKCKSADMQDTKSRRCFCGKAQPIFGYEDKSPTHCESCKANDMEDVINRKCKASLCGGNRAASNPKYKGHCRLCFVNLFPNEPISKNYKTKEKEVAKSVIAAFPQHKFEVDKRIDQGCSRRRPDLFLDLLTHVIICEVDENEHNSYDTTCENKRIMQLSEDVAHRPLVFLRFNPDGYTDDKGIRHASPWKHTNVGLGLSKEHQIEWNKRLSSLHSRIRYWIDTVPDKTITMELLFFSESIDAEPVNESDISTVSPQQCSTSTVVKKEPRKILPILKPLKS
jgi:hypothetical protein